eukprot:COSAG01_NODE_63087_length_281_cov_1.093407_1_plen_22_part_01
MLLLLLPVSAFRARSLVQVYNT